MTDGVILGNGNSRYLKSVSNFLSAYPTYEDFAKALIAGNLPIDLNGINTAGWAQLGTALNKANLLSDATAALFGLGTGAVPDDALELVAPVVSEVSKKGNCSIEVFTYTGTGSTTLTITFPGRPDFLIVSGRYVKLFDTNQSPNYINFVCVTQSGQIFARGGGMSTTWSNGTLTIDLSNWDVSYGNTSGEVYQVIAFYRKDTD